MESAEKFGSANAVTGVRRRKTNKRPKAKKSTKRIKRQEPKLKLLETPNLPESQILPETPSQSQNPEAESSSSPSENTSEAPQLSQEAVAAMNAIVEEHAPEPEPEPAAAATPAPVASEEERLVDAADIATAVQLMGFMAFMKTRIPVANFSNEEAEMVALPTEKAANHLYQVIAPYLPDYVRQFIRQNRKNFALFGEIGMAVKAWKELFALKEKQLADYLEAHPEDVARLRTERAA